MSTIKFVNNGMNRNSKETNSNKYCIKYCIKYVKSTLYLEMYSI